MGKVRGTRPGRSIIVNPDGEVVVPAIIPVTAIIAGVSAIIAIIYLSMKHRERMEKIKRGAANK